MEVGEGTPAPWPDRPTPSPREQRHPIVSTSADRAQVRQLEYTADRLRSTVLRLRADLARLPEPERDPAPAPVSYDRKSYAPSPVGRIDPAAAAGDELPPPPPPPPIEDHGRVTNLGTLIDVLA